MAATETVGWGWGGGRNCERRQGGNGEPDHVCRQSKVLCLFIRVRSKANLTCLKRINLAIVLKVNQREQRVETRIERMVPWTKVVALEMLRMFGICIDLKGRANGIF